MFAFVNGTLNISAANQTITFAPPGDATYGAPPIALTATASSQLAEVSGSVLTITGAGRVSVTASQNGNADYAAAIPVQQSFTVSPAILTVKANNATMAYGQPLPSLTFTPSGFVNNDTASVLSGTPSESTAATSTTAPGTYPITIAQGTLSASNYSYAL